MRFSLALVALLVAVPMASAQTFVYPPQNATTEGGGDNSWPFRYTQNAGHYQQSYDATQFPAGPMIITGLSFRTKSDTAKPASSADFKMTLSYCATPWNALSPTFATNVGASPTVVFDGVWNIAAFPGAPGVAPNPFYAILTLTTPFVYDPLMGDLLMDVEMRASCYPTTAGTYEFCASGVAMSRIYANTGNPKEASGTLGTYGLITEFTAGPAGIIPYGTGCAGAGGFVPALSMTGTPKVGSQVTLALDKGLGGVLSALLITGAKGSIPLGGGCTLLLAGNPITLFIPLGGSGPGTGSYQLPAVIPVVTPVTIYMQAFVNDPAGPIGLSVSNGLQVDIK